MIEIIRIRYDILNSSHIIKRVTLQRKHRFCETAEEVEYLRKKIELKAQYKVEQSYRGDPEHMPIVSVLIDTKVKEKYYQNLRDKRK